MLKNKLMEWPCFTNTVAYVLHHYRFHIKLMLNNTLTVPQVAYTAFNLLEFSTMSVQREWIKVSLEYFSVTQHKIGYYSHYAHCTYVLTIYLPWRLTHDMWNISVWSSFPTGHICAEYYISTIIKKKHFLKTSALWCEEGKWWLWTQPSLDDPAL